MKTLTNLQRLGISFLILQIYAYDSSVDKGGLLDFKRDNNSKFINVYYRCYNNKRYVFTVQANENIDDEIEYRVKFDNENKMFRIIDIDDVKGWNA